MEAKEYLEELVAKARVAQAEFETYPQEKVDAALPRCLQGSLRQRRNARTHGRSTRPAWAVTTARSPSAATSPRRFGSHEGQEEPRHHRLG